MRGRRRARGDGTPYNYGKAYSAIDQIENKLFYAKVIPTFSAQDVAEILWEPHVRDVMKSAHVLMDRPTSRFDGSAVSENHMAALHPALYRIGVHCESLHMAAPAAGLIRPNRQHPRFSEFMGAIADTLDVVSRGRKLRKVIEWAIAHNVTPGALRYYCPSVVTLLPSENAIHNSDGFRYKEVADTADVAGMIPLFREVAEVVATGALLPDVDNTRELGVTVQFSTGVSQYSRLFPLCPTGPMLP